MIHFLPVIPLYMDVTVCKAKRVGLQKLAGNFGVGERYYHITIFFPPNHSVCKGSCDISPQDLTLILHLGGRICFHRSKLARNRRPSTCLYSRSRLVEAPEGCDLAVQYTTCVFQEPAVKGYRRL
jgi:hypothetical protein